jgi:hypothetical protein
MFIIDSSPEFTADVPLSRPGLSEPVAIKVTFRHKNRDALKTWIASAPGTDDVQLLNEVIVSWSGMQDAEGKTVAYDVTALSRLLNNYPPARGELFRVYLSELTDAKRKN